MSSHHPRPICTVHLVEMRCAENSVTVRDRAVGGFHASYWVGDRFECPHPDCTASIITGFSDPTLDGDKEDSLVFSYALKKEPK